jgi:NTE family protein
MVRMTKVGVVLGAGGIVGMAFHAGTLAALQDAGFDARTASVIVGTSAGSVVGTTLRAGLPPRDQLARAEGRAMSAEGRAVSERWPAPRRTAIRPTAPRSFRPASPLIALRGRPGLALAGLLPEGSVPTADIVERVRTMTGGKWPTAPLWICAVRLGDGRRVVFGRDDVSADIGAAVAASSAIPGYFQPVEIGGHKYVDGGVHSPTNADLLAGEACDIVVVVSTMSGTTAALRRPSFTGRGLHTISLRTEVARLRRSGAQVLTFQPTPADVAVMGTNAMDPGRAGAVARRAYESATARLADARVADRLTLLT